jgi:hypothetical protein
MLTGNRVAINVPSWSAAGRAPNRQVGSGEMGNKKADLVVGLRYG